MFKVGEGALRESGSPESAAVSFVGGAAAVVLLRLDSTLWSSGAGNRNCVVVGTGVADDQSAVPVDELGAPPRELRGSELGLVNAKGVRISPSTFVRGVAG